MFGIILINICIENFLMLYQLYICVPSDMLLPKQYHHFENHLSFLLLIFFSFNVSFNCMLCKVLWMLCINEIMSIFVFSLIYSLFHSSFTFE